MIDPIYYNISLNPIVWGLLGAMLMCFVLIALILWPKLSCVAKRVAQDSVDSDSDQPLPSVSVIVYSQADGANLRTLLPTILNQDYPAPMEVIVVNDRSADNTDTIVSELELSYPNLYMTFAPEDSRNLSRRKLSITLGIKAARHEALLLTCGNCRIDSPLWMRAMMRHFANPETQVVIGYAYPDAYDEPDHDKRRRTRSFDHVWQSVRYLSAALRRHPFMGTGYNIAYRRSLFFEHKGFSKTLNLNYGDDDLFINEITTPHNTAVEISHQAQVASQEQYPAAFHTIYTLRRAFTAKMLPRRFYLSLATTSWMWWIWPLCGAGAIYFALPSLIPAAIVGVLSLTFCLIHSSIWRKCSRALHGRSLFLTVPFLSWSRPIRTLWMRLRSRRSNQSNLTQLI